MKKIIFGLVAMMLLTASSITSAQSSKDASKERQEMAKASKKALNEKASKNARKEAKRLTKEGWKTTPGALPLEKQLDKSYIMQYQYDSDGYPLYFMAEAMSIGGNYDAAKLQALELAKHNIAGQIQTEITALVENDFANEQMEQNEAASIIRTVMESQTLISQSLGRLIPVVETYRTINGQNKEVLVRIAYPQNAAKSAAKQVIKKGLEERGDSLHKKLDKVLGW